MTPKILEQRQLGLCAKPVLAVDVSDEHTVAKKVKELC